MGALAEIIVQIRGITAAAPLSRATKAAERAQTRFLRALLRRNAETVFGKEHGFGSITTPQEYARAVPIRDYEGFRPYVERICQGGSALLTRDHPFMFTTTSGTTAEPKLLPVTQHWKADTASLMRIWLYWASRDHPGLFDGGVMSVVSPAVEGYTEGGQPFGSVSGLTYQCLPSVVRRTYAIPYEVMTIQDYEDRYFASIRLAVGRDVSLIATPNPSTLLRLAHVLEKRAEEILRAVRDGRLGLDPAHLTADGADEQRLLYQRLDAQISPDPERAKLLENRAARDGRLLPRYGWPNLRLIGCWLGGSCGVQAGPLRELYGPDIPLRDLGLRASEATVTIPFSDETAAGVLALHTGFYEFVDVSSMDAEAPPVLLAHELEEGRSYYLLLTTSAGLYRYNINDIVEVSGFLERAPVLKFVRKGRDMVSITGEKLHVSQILHAMESAQRIVSLRLVQFRIIPDVAASRYDLLLELPSGADRHLVNELGACFDRQLGKANIEYGQKRASGRLGSVRLHVMKDGWSERRWRADIARGKRDSQYKWPYIQLEWDEEQRQEIGHSLSEGNTGTR